MIPVVATAAAAAAATSSPSSPDMAASAATCACPAPATTPVVAACKGRDGGVARCGCPAALALAETQEVDGNVERACAVEGVRGRQVEPELQGQDRGRGRV